MWYITKKQAIQFLMDVTSLGRFSAYGPFSSERAARELKAFGSDVPLKDLAKIVAEVSDVDYKNSILEMWYSERDHLILKKSMGTTSVPKHFISAEPGASNQIITIDEAIAYWQKGIDEMEAGADQSLYNY